MLRLHLDTRRLALAGALVALAAAAAGCGSGVPADGVASVGGTLITKPEFAHWYALTAKQQAAQSGGAVSPATAPDPPDFTRCIAARGAQPPQPGVPTPSPSTLKTQCEQAYQTLRDGTMQFIVSAQWLLSEAARRHITVTDQQVNQSFVQQKQQAFPHPQDYDRYLAQTGQNQADINFRIKLQLIQDQIKNQVTNRAARVTPAQVAAYYASNKQRFAQPESRDLLVVLTRKAADAKAALAAVKSGQPWAAVAKKYSIETASKSAGGKLPGVTRGQQEPALDSAIFSAPPGQVEGPVKTQTGYYVFEVTNVTPARQQSLAQATQTIEGLLRSQHQQTALSSFVRSFQDGYLERTTCADGYLVARICSNAPKTAPVSGAPPVPGKPELPPRSAGSQALQQQGVPQQGVPQQGAPQQGAPQQGAPPPTGP